MRNEKFELPLLLIRVAILNTPEAYEGEIDWEFLMDFGKKQDILPILLRGIRLLALPMPPAIQAQLQKAEDLALGVEAAQFIALGQLFTLCERRGISCAPLKGSVLRELYPLPHLRTMGDIDLLIAPFDPRENRRMMAELGFAPDDKMIRDPSEYDVVTDNYSLPPFLVVELHKTLSAANTPVAIREAFCDALKTAEPLEGYSLIKRFSAQGNFLHLMSHLHKHYTEDSVGVRMLLDIWLFHSAYGSQLDWNVLNERLAHMGILDFCTEILRLCHALFSYGEEHILTPEQERIFLAGKLHEDMPIVLRSLKNAKTGCLSPLLHTVLISRKHLAAFYPRLNCCPVLYPYYYCKRALFVLRSRRHKLRQIIFVSFTKQGREQLRELRERKGL